MILCDDFILISQFMFFLNTTPAGLIKKRKNFEEELCENTVTFLHFDVFCQFLYIAYMVAPKAWFMVADAFSIEMRCFCS